MAYIIAEPCIGTKDTACVDACPVDCIHPKKDTQYSGHEVVGLSDWSLSLVGRRVARRK